LYIVHKEESAFTNGLRREEVPFVKAILTGDIVERVLGPNLNIVFIGSSCDLTVNTMYRKRFYAAHWKSRPVSINGIPYHLVIIKGKQRGCIPFAKDT
jgi:hypothetical protein